MTEDSGTTFIKVEDLIHLAMGPQDKHVYQFKTLEKVLYTLAKHINVLEQKVEIPRTVVEKPCEEPCEDPCRPKVPGTAEDSQKPCLGPSGRRTRPAAHQLVVGPDGRLVRISDLAIPDGKQLIVGADGAGVQVASGPEGVQVASGPRGVQAVSGLEGVPMASGPRGVQAASSDGRPTSAADEILTSSDDQPTTGAHRSTLARRDAVVDVNSPDDLEKNVYLGKFALQRKLSICVAKSVDIWPRGRESNAGSRPKQKLGRPIGSIEVVTRHQFTQLEEAVEVLMERVKVSPTPTLPDNEQLVDDILAGTASLAKTVTSLQISSRIIAAEKAISNMADMLKQLMSSHDKAVTAEGQQLLGPESNLIPTPGVVAIGPDGKPIIGLGGVSVDPNGKPGVTGPDGVPVGPDGKPLLEVLLPYGKTYVGLDGKPITGPLPGGVLLKPDGTPNTGPGGIALGLDGKPITGLGGVALDPDGRPITRSGEVILGPDGKPLIGPDGRVSVPDGKPLIGPDGVALETITAPGGIALDPDGKPLIGPGGSFLGTDVEPLLGPDGRLITGPDGMPFGLDGKLFVGPDGIALGPDGIPTTRQGGITLSPDGKTIIGPDGIVVGLDGKPLIGPVVVTIGPGGRSIAGTYGMPLGLGSKPFIGPGGMALGPDGTPTTEQGGISLRPDGKTVIGPGGIVLGPDGKILSGPVGVTIGPDGRSITGTDGMPLDHDGKPLVGPAGIALGLKGRPTTGQGGISLSPDGKTVIGPGGIVLGPDGKILSGPIGVTIGPDGRFITGTDETPLGRNGKPLVGPGGIALRPDVTLTTGQGGISLIPDGKIIIGPGGIVLGPDGKPLIGPVGVTIGPDGRSITGTDGTPLGLDGKPLVGPAGIAIGLDGRPTTGQGGIFLSPDGKRIIGSGGIVLGPDGKPLIGPVGVTIGPDGRSIIGTDGTPFGLDGKPLVGLGRINLGPDGKPIIRTASTVLGPDGKPISGPGMITYGPDGREPRPGEVLDSDGKPLIGASLGLDGGAINGPDQLVFGPEGIVLGPDSLIDPNEIIFGSDGRLITQTVGMKPSGQDSLTISGASGLIYCLKETSASNSEYLRSDKKSISQPPDSGKTTELRIVQTDAMAFGHDSVGTLSAPPSRVSKSITASHKEYTEASLIEVEVEPEEMFEPPPCVTVTEMDMKMNCLQEELMQHIKRTITGTLSPIDRISREAGSFIYEWTIASELITRIECMQEMTENYARHLDSNRAAIDMQLQCYGDQITMLRHDLESGLAQLEEICNSSESEAVIDLTHQYDNLTAILEARTQDGHQLVAYQNDISLELRSLVDAVEVMREEKADRDEVLDGLRDKADTTKLTGLLTEREFQESIADLEQRLLGCDRKMLRQGEVWQVVTADCAEILATKADLSMLENVRDSLQGELVDLHRKVQCIADIMKEPKAAVVIRQLRKRVACAPGGAPFLTELPVPPPPLHAVMPSEPRPEPTGAEDDGASPDSCLRTVLLELEGEELPATDQRRHLCRRWVGGSHTLVGADAHRGSVTRERTAGVMRMRPVKPTLACGTNGKMYHVEEELAPCVECNQYLARVEGDKGGSELPGGVGREGGAVKAVAAEHVKPVEPVSSARRVTVLRDGDLRALPSLGPAGAEPAESAHERRRTGGDSNVSLTSLDERAEMAEKMLLRSLALAEQEVARRNISVGEMVHGRRALSGPTDSDAALADARRLVEDAKSFQNHEDGQPNALEEFED